ncbi:MAG TPA: SBBP repeat-containing protein [bacterium]|nr:SBBP repeat-containing protein [bacterium]
MKSCRPLHLLLVFLLFAACDRSPIDTVTDASATADGDALLIDTPTESDDILMPDEDSGENEAVPEKEDVGKDEAVPEKEVALPDEDFISEDGACGQVAEPDPVETDRIVRLTRQWGGTSLSGIEDGKSVAFDSFGNMYIAGRTNSSFDCHQNKGGTDIILMKMAMDGTLLWSRQWGTSEADWALAVAVDTDGNIFVAGVTDGSLDGNQNTNGGRDIFVTKWTGDGGKVWTKQRLAGSVSAITFDDEGNLIMTGYSGGDLLLAKWDNDGNEIWTVLWGEHAGGNGYAVAIAPNGDILVAGDTIGDLDGNTNAGGRCTCYEFPTSSGQVGCMSCYDIFLSRFTSAGVRLSTRQWGLYNSDDTAYRVFVAEDGSIFVAGTTEGSFYGTVNAGGNCGYNYCSDVFLSRLDATGNVIWTRAWGMPGDDHFGGLVSDGTGIIAAGGATLLKYDFDGGEAWTGDIGTPFPNDLARSGDGAIAVTGYQITGGNNYDVFAGVWGSSGVAEWSKTFSGNNSAEQGRALAVAANGAVFMAGSTDGAFTGNQSAGGVDTFLAKSNGEGLLHWIEQAGTPERDEASSVAIDTDGSIYITGHTYGSLDDEVSAGGADIYLMKRKNDGEKVWTRQWGTDRDDVGYAVAVDGDGSVYVAGLMDGSLSDDRGHAFLTKMTSAGAEVWTKEWSSQSSDPYAAAYSVAYGVSVDQTGNIFVTGETVGDMDGQTNKGSSCMIAGQSTHGAWVSIPILCADGFLIKFTSDGVKEWTVQWGTPQIDSGRAITVGSDGFVYIAGSSGDYTTNDSAEGVRQALLAKWSPDGENVWTELWDSVEWSDARSVAVNADDDIFVTGYSIGSLDGVLSAFGGSDVFLAKMNDTGARLWAEQWGSALGDYGNAVAVGPDGKIFVAGYTVNAFDGNLNSGGTDIFLSIIDEK